MGQILCIALALIVGLLSSRLMKLIRLPNVTGYLIAGIIFGPYVLGPYIGGWTIDGGIVNNISTTNIETITWISDIALGFVAFTIGTSFSTSTLKDVGKRAGIITVFEALGGCVIVLIGLIIAWSVSPNTIALPVVLTLAAIACATAPAATLMVVRQYKAKGPVVNTLLPVVALDDAVALIMFAILFSIAKTLDNGTELNIISITVIPLLEILLSLGLGALLGFLISLASKIYKSRSNRMIWCIAAILIAVGISSFKVWFGFEFEFSPLLICMMIGAFYVNLTKDNEKTLDVIDRFTPPLFLLFFVISGAELDITIFANPTTGLVVGVGTSIYVICRSMGKWFGAFAGAEITKCEPTVKKYLGFTLLPQAGVAIGLATSASKSLTNSGSTILAIILTATIVYELFGPVITKFALTKAGEITPEVKKTESKV